jgi:hypothetical protein
MFPKRKWSFWLIRPCHCPLEVLSFLSHASLHPSHQSSSCTSEPSTSVIFVISLGKNGYLMQENVFHSLSHTYSSIMIRQPFVGMESRQVPMSWGCFFLVFMVVVVGNGKSFPLCLWLVRAHKSFGSLLLKVWKQMGWLERNTKPGMPTVAKRNTFRLVTLLSLLINYQRSIM